MAYHIDPTDGSLVIDTFQNGIGSDPYSGLTDLKSVNPSSISGEASVSFSTTPVFNEQKYLNATGSTTTGTNLFNIPSLSSSVGLETAQWVTFSNVGTSGLSTATPYYALYDGNSGGNNHYQLFTATAAYPPSGSAVTITGSSAVVFSTINPGLIKYFAKSRGSNWMIDANGRVWSDITTTGIGGGPITSSWVYTGNTVDSNSNGNGIVCYQTVTDSTGGAATPAGIDEWIFIFRNSGIDYTKITANGVATSPIITWVYGWKPGSGTTGTSLSTGYLQNLITINNSHQAIVTPDGRVDYCDANFISVFYQNVPTPGSNYTGFNPATQATYTFSTYTILPFNDTAQCMGFINASLLVGGKLNIVYPWDLTSPTYSTPLIQLPESNVQAIINVGQNGYIFAGNRGWIYQTNGSQASPYKKIPDHISGAVEPLISWGGSATAGAPTGTVTFNKNRLYFGCQVSLQGGGNAMGYGGIWCLDLNSGTLWNSNQMSYGSYAGYVSALIVPAAQTNYSPSIGYGVLAGWSDGGNTGNFGVDASIAAPYTNGASMVVSDLIPVGTLLRPMTPLQFEAKTSMPLLTGESISLYAGYSLADYVTGNMTFIGTITGGSTTYGQSAIVSGNFPTLVQNQQWLIVQAILTGISSNPSYNRLVQLRVFGDTIKTQIAGQPYALQ